MFENVITSLEGAVAPKVIGFAFSLFIPLNILHDNGFGFEADFIHSLQTQKAERDKLLVAVFVADDEGGEAAGGQELIAVAGGVLEAVQEGSEGRGVGDIVGVVGEFDDVVVGGVEEEELGE